MIFTGLLGQASCASADSGSAAIVAAALDEGATEHAAVSWFSGAEKSGFASRVALGNHMMITRPARHQPA